MGKLMRRFFPKYPAVGAVLGVIILCEAVAIADVYKVGYGIAHEGGWTVNPEPYDVGGPTCYYTHTDDTATYIQGHPDPVWRHVDDHYNTCWGYMPSSGSCNASPHTYGPDLHCGPDREDHLDRYK